MAAVGRKTRVFMNGVDITEYIKNPQVVQHEVDDDTDILFDEIDVNNLSAYLVSFGKVCIDLTMYTGSIDFSVEPFLCDCELTYSDGSVAKFRVYDSTWFNDKYWVFLCDNCPPIPDGLFKYAGYPIHFRNRSTYNG